MLLFDQTGTTGVSTRLLDLISAEAAVSLCGLLLERVARTPDEVAYVQFDEPTQTWIETTWRDTARTVAHWQAALTREGLSPGDRVAIMMRNRREWVAFDLAALGLGLVTVPLYPNDRAEAIRHILDEAGVRLLLLETAAQRVELSAIDPTLARLKRLLILEPGETALPADTHAVSDWLGEALTSSDHRPIDRVDNPDALATIVYTSGTTGHPKGVMLSHRNILWNAEASLALIPARVEDRFLSFLPLSHTLERTAGCVLPIMAGSSVTFARSIPQLAEDLLQIQPTVMIAVPRIFERVHAKLRERLDGESPLKRRLFEHAVSTGWARFEHSQGRARWHPRLLAAPLLDRLVGAKIRARFGGRLRVAVCGGAPLAPDIAHVFLGLGVPLVQGYGLTETSPVISVSPLDDNIPESVGRPLPGLEYRIGDLDELIVRSPGVMSGYWKQPQATAEVLDAEGWLKTGDQVRIQDGHIFITGRIKDVLVLANGEKVAPADIELAITVDPLFEQVLVIGEGRPFLSALVVLNLDVYARVAQAEGLPADPMIADADGRLEPVLQDRIERKLTGFSGYAKIRRVALAACPWSIENDRMTPTMKLKRAKILADYREALTRLYVGHEH
ncbi:AMP-dependent synthetase/ligase [Thiocapsa bogorovii]|uniref:AMP-dependent synthetase/ligase n=1 Tax=Thiocapsa bogorovii TaxID=521689 RepID=UPI001E582345|nr:long-chain fatty acid--CoA ligase [Thiocapsa bogorovii]UHD17368.1 long-chain fatty acid--CoA ligase [Thiocapsa bogorovii]